MAAREPADWGWIGLAAYVVAFNTYACVRRRKMLSERCDDYLGGVHRWIAETIIAAVYVHVSNRVPPRYDPIHWTFVAVRETCQRITH